MRIIRFPDKFCMDSKPYWALFALFLVSNILLVYTLYTKQPERYRHSSQWISSNFHFGKATRSAEAANLVSPPRQSRRTGSSRAVATTGTSTLDDTTTSEFLGMVLANASINSSGKRSPETLLRGVVIASIDKNSIPYLSGFRRNDVIVSLNRTPTHSVTDFLQIAASCSPTEGMLFDIYREGKRYYMTIRTRNVAR